jgi:vancomycin resistance protein VanJ
MTKSKTTWLQYVASGVVVVYATGVSGWAIAHRLVGDGFWLLALANAFAVYLFAPLPAMALLAALARRRGAWIALLIVTLLFFRLFGGDLLPPSPVARAGADGPELTVMTYNVLFANTDATPIVTSVTDAEPDLVAFQELPPFLAQQLEPALGAQYPYRTPSHANCYAGAAIWSRYPLQVEAVEDDMLCRVNSVVVDFDGQPVRVVNVHAWSYTGLDRASVEQSFQWRREQVASILNMIEGQPESLILLGDLNSTPMHEMYQVLDRHLVDAFREAGWGLGHTYPATQTRFRGIPLPGLMVRIDHIFHSDDWRAEAAGVLAWDGASDHRAVVARLRLLDTD